MFSSNSLNINSLSLNKNSKLVNKVSQPHQWMAIKDINNNQELFQLYNNICQKYQTRNKWILMINPEDESLEQLASQNKYDVSRILRVNIKTKNIDINCIEKALSKGNCSAIIVSNSQLKQHQLKQLSKSAKKGKTQCIVLENNLTIH